MMPSMAGTIQWRRRKGTVGKALFPTLISLTAFAMADFTVCPKDVLTQCYLRWLEPAVRNWLFIDFVASSQHQ